MVGEDIREERRRKGSVSGSEVDFFWAVTGKGKLVDLSPPWGFDLRLRIKAYISDIFSRLQIDLTPFFFLFGSDHSFVLEFVSYGLCDNKGDRRVSIA